MCEKGENADEQHCLKMFSKVVCLRHGCLTLGSYGKHLCHFHVLDPVLPCPCLADATGSQTLLRASFAVELMVKDEEDTGMYSIICIQKPPKGSKKSGLLQQLVYKCRGC